MGKGSLQHNFIEIGLKYEPYSFLYLAKKIPGKSLSWGKSIRKVTVEGYYTERKYSFPFYNLSTSSTPNVYLKITS